MGLVCRFMNEVDISKGSNRDLIFGSKMRKTNNIKLFSSALEKQGQC